MLRRLLYFGLFVATALGLKAETAFQPGDHLSYDLYWSFIKVGTAELRFEAARLTPDGPDLLHATFTVQTSGIAEKLFKVRDKIESWIDPATGQPLFYKKKQREGKTERDIEVHFDWATGSATYTKNGATFEPQPITDQTRDPLSLIVAIASTTFKEGESHALAATDGKRLVYVDVLRQADQKLNLKAGQFNAQHLEVATNELQGVFEKSPDASIELWLSQETPALPLKMKSEVAVGSFYGKLREFSVQGYQ